MSLSIAIKLNSTSKTCFFTTLGKRKLLTTDSFVEILPNMNSIIYDPLNVDLTVNRFRRVAVCVMLYAIRSAKSGHPVVGQSLDRLVQRWLGADVSVVATTFLSWDSSRNIKNIFPDWLAKISGKINKSYQPANSTFREFLYKSFFIINPKEAFRKIM